MLISGRARATGLAILEWGTGFSFANINAPSAPASVLGQIAALVFVKWDAVSQLSGGVVALAELAVGASHGDALVQALSATADLPIVGTLISH